MQITPLMFYFPHPPPPRPVNVPHLVTTTSAREAKRINLLLYKVYLTREIMATGGISRHTIIFSRACLFLVNEEEQDQQEELKKAIRFLLSKPDQFKVYFTSHEYPSAGMLSAIPKR